MDGSRPHRLEGTQLANQLQSLQSMPQLRAASAVFILFAITACRAGTDPATGTASSIRTIDNTVVQAAPIDPPPTVNEQETTFNPTIEVVPGSKLEGTKDERQAQMVDLPFAPAIAMDPVTGGKVSIRLITPKVEFKNKVYYFVSEDSKRQFMSDPETFSKGAMARY